MLLNKIFTYVKFTNLLKNAKIKNDYERKFLIDRKKKTNFKKD